MSPTRAREGTYARCRLNFGREAEQNMPFFLVCFQRRKNSKCLYLWSFENRVILSGCRKKEVQDQREESINFRERRTARHPYHRDIAILLILRGSGLTLSSVSRNDTTYHPSHIVLETAYLRIRFSF
jgi:hypothetical protein